MSSSETKECQLYLITPPLIDDLDAFAVLLENAFQAGPVACLQLRLKEVSDDYIVTVAERLKPLCHDRDIAFLINDRIDLAKQVGADGVHLGQQDGSIAEARRFLGAEASIGVTCRNSMHLAFEAGDAGADYVAFGSFYPSPTKKTEYRADPSLLSQWAEIAEIPSVAIGGIGVEESALLAASGADFIAVSSGVWNHKDGAAAAVKAYNKAITSPDLV